MRGHTDHRACTLPAWPNLRAGDAPPAGSSGGVAAGQAPGTRTGSQPTADAPSLQQPPRPQRPGRPVAGLWWSGQGR